MLIFNVICNLIFIPLYGMHAAALSTLITEIIILGAQYHLLKNTPLIIKLNKQFVPGVIFCSLIFAAYIPLNMLSQFTASYFHIPQLSLFIAIAYGILIAGALAICAPNYWFHNIFKRKSPCAY